MHVDGGNTYYPMAGGIREEGGGSNYPPPPSSESGRIKSTLFQQKTCYHITAGTTPMILKPSAVSYIIGY